MADTPLRLLFAGTPHFAASFLGALIDSEHKLLGVYSQPDRPVGRGRKLQASPVKELAQQAGLPVFQPASLKDQGARRELEALGADLMIVVAYGLILPQAVLDIPRHGCLNVHASLLPRWRGAAPIQRAIEAGDEETGVTIMRMDAGLDTGDMLATARCRIGTETTSGSLHDELAALGAPLLLEVLADLPARLARAETQDDAEACYAAKISKQEAQLNWTLDASVLDRKIRAFDPAPGCFTILDGERVKIWRGRCETGSPQGDVPGTILRADRDGILVACGEGRLCVEKLQLPGGKPMTAAQLLNAGRQEFTPGRIFDLGAPDHV